MTNRPNDFQGMFPQELRTEIARLNRELTDEERRSASGVIEDKELKKRLAQSCLKMFEYAAQHELPLEAVYALIGGFSFSEYGDSLDEAFALLHEIDFGFEYLREDTVEKQIDRIKQYLNDYGNCEA